MSILNVSVLDDKDILQVLVSSDHGANHTYLPQESETLKREVQEKVEWLQAQTLLCPNKVNQQIGDYLCQLQKAIFIPI